MSRKQILIAVLVIVLLLSATVAMATGKSELVAVRLSTAEFRNPEAAQAAGYDLLPGLDHCFNNPGVGAMGYHYIDASSLDLSLEPTRPEAIVYAPMPDGRLKLVAVEYIVPAEPWDAAGNSAPPSLFGQQLHLNEALGVYVLHAWIWLGNPAGVFADWNPNVSCP